METKYFERPEGTIAYDDSQGEGQLVMMMPGRFDPLKELGFTTKIESENRLSQLKTPTLVIMGTKDPDWPDPEAEARIIADSVSGELVLIENAGHYPQTEMPEKVAPVVLAILGKASQ